MNQLTPTPAPQQLKAPVQLSKAPDQLPAVVLQDARKEELKRNVDSYVAALLTQDVHSDEFRKKIDAAFKMGREEIAQATTLSNALTKTNFVGLTDDTSFKALTELQEMFDKLNPANQGDLFAAPKVLGIPLPTKVLGIPLPGANKLKTYLRRFEAAEAPMARLAEGVANAQELVEKSVTELGNSQSKLWGAAEMLEERKFFMEQFMARLTGQVDSMKLTDPDRARAFEQEVLYYVSTNLSDIMKTQALALTGYQMMAELRKTGRETVIGCNQFLTIGMSALSVGVTIAQGTGVQRRTQATLVNARQSVENLITATGQGMLQHAQATSDFANNPMMGVEKLKSMFVQVDEASKILETYRSNALQVNKANNAVLSQMLDERMTQQRLNRSAADVASQLPL